MNHTPLKTIQVTNTRNPIERPHQLSVELRKMKELLQMHHYPIRKLACREVWRIGRGEAIFLLSYTTSPTLQWVLFPHNNAIANVIDAALAQSTTQKEGKSA